MKQQAGGRSLEAHLYAAYRRVPFTGTQRLEEMGIHLGEMRGWGCLRQNRQSQKIKETKDIL